MARFIRKSRSDIGASPFELTYRGKQSTEEVQLRVIDFDEEHLEERRLDSIQEVGGLIPSKSVTWLNVDGLSDSSIIQNAGEVFQLDRLVLAEIVNVDQRPRVADYESYLVISIKMLQYDEQQEELDAEHLSIVFGKGFLISFQEKVGDVFDPVRDRIRKQKKKIRTSGSDYLCFALLDIVVDHYIYILSIMGEKIELLEDELIDNPTRSMLERINDYKREIHYLRKNILPARELINTLIKTETELIHTKSTGVHWKELQDNLHQAIETSDSYRDILSDMMNIYHTTVSTKLNDIMKFLTIFSVIFIPLTFIAGIYGTNFEYVPELSYKYSYFIMWGVMIVITIVMVLYFKSRKWF